MKATRKKRREMFTHKTPRIGKIYSKMDERMQKSRRKTNIKRERKRESERTKTERKEGSVPSIFKSLLILPAAKRVCFCAQRICVTL